MVNIYLIVSSAALSASLISLALSIYAVKRKQKIVAAEPWIPAGRNLTPVSEAETFLTKDERREAIAAEATSAEAKARMEAMAVIRSNPFALIPPDPASQSDHASWRSRFIK